MAWVVGSGLMAHRSFRAFMIVVKGLLGNHTPASSATIVVVTPLPALRCAKALGVFLPPAGNERDRHDVPPCQSEGCEEEFCSEVLVLAGRIKGLALAAHGGRQDLAARWEPAFFQNTEESGPLGAR